MEDEESSSESTVKRVGRKLSLSQPASKRKAQNRAAQRSFRERKERYLRELEGRIMDLNQASKSKDVENEKLRIRVQALEHDLSIQLYDHAYSGIHTPDSSGNSAPTPKDHPDLFLVEPCRPLNSSVPPVNIDDHKSLPTDVYQGFINSLQNTSFVPTRMNDDLMRENASDGN